VFKNKKITSTLITSIVGIVIVIIAAASSHDPHGYGALAVALVMGFECIGMLLIGLILHARPETRAIGSGVMLGMLITMLIGFGICSSV
jgi:hypothetical protein